MCGILCAYVVKPFGKSSQILPTEPSTLYPELSTFKILSLIMPNRKQHQRAGNFCLNALLARHADQLRIFCTRIEDNAPRLQAEDIIVVRALVIGIEIERDRIHATDGRLAILNRKPFYLAFANAYRNDLMAMRLQALYRHVGIAAGIGRSAEYDRFFHENR